MGRELTIFGRLAHERGMRYSHFVRDFEKTADELRIDPGAAPSRRQFDRWMYGQVKTLPKQPETCMVLERMFGGQWSAQDLLAPPGPTGSAGDQQLGHHAEAAVPPSYGRPDGTTDSDARACLGAEPHHRKRAAAMAADRALRFAMAAETRHVGTETLAHLADEVRRLAQEYPRVPLNRILADLIDVQDLIFRVLESGHARPTQARELHLLAAIASGMLAKASHDMGDPGPAMRQARAAYVCADQADHTAMRAWVRGLQSLIAYWHGRPQDAARYAQSGAAVVGTATGTVTVWLAALDARAHALLGDDEAVEHATAATSRLRERVMPDELDDVGGLLTFPRPRQLYYTAEAEVLTPGIIADAEVHAEEAVHAYQQAEQEAPQEWAFGDQAGASTNLALARLARSDVDGAAAALRPVLDLPPAQHIGGIVLSAQRVHRALCSGPVRTALASRSLRAEIEAFAATPAQVMLP